MKQSDRAGGGDRTRTALRPRDFKSNRTHENRPKGPDDNLAALRLRQIAPYNF